jgi:chromosome segregation ATPase
MSNLLDLISAIESQGTQINTNLDNLKQNNNQFKDKLLTKLQELQRLINNIDPNKLKENKAQFEKSTSDLQESRKELEEKTNELNRLQGELTNAQSQVAELTQQIQQLNDKERTLTTDLEKLNRQMEQTNAINSDLTRKVEETTTQLSAIQSERDGLNQQLQSNLTELSSLQEIQSSALEGLNRIKGLIDVQLSSINQIMAEQNEEFYAPLIESLKVNLEEILNTIGSTSEGETKQSEFPSADDFFNMSSEDKMRVVNMLKQQGTSERLISALERVLTERPLNRENVARRYNDIVESFRTTRGGRRHRRKTMKRRRKVTKKRRRQRGGYTYGKESPELRSQSSEVSMMTSSSGKTSSRRKYRGTRRRSRS